MKMEFRCVDLGRFVPAFQTACTHVYGTVVVYRNYIHIGWCFGNYKKYGKRFFSSMAFSITDGQSTALNITSWLGTWHLAPLISWHLTSRRNHKLMH